MSASGVVPLVRSEIKKITSTRLWWALLIGGLLFTAISAGAAAGFAGVDPGAGQPATPGLETSEAVRSVYAGSTFSGMYIFAVILGITGMTGEYRYKTITPTFLATPRRSRVVVAKMLAHLGVGVLFGVAALGAALVVGGAVTTVRGYDLGLDADRLWSSCALAVLAVAMWTILGIGIGTLVRNQVFAILLAVLVTFLIEPLVSFGLARLDRESIGKYLPGNASTALTSPGNSIVEYLDWWAGGLVLLAYTLVLAGLGMLLSVRRDVT